MLATARPSCFFLVLVFMSVLCFLSTIMVNKDVYLYTLCLKKNGTDVAHYNFNAHQPILLIFGRDIAE